MAEKKNVSLWFDIIIWRSAVAVRFILFSLFLNEIAHFIVISKHILSVFLVIKKISSSTMFMNRPLNLMLSIKRSHTFINNFRILYAVNISYGHLIYGKQAVRGQCISGRYSPVINDLYFYLSVYFIYNNI